MKLADMIKIMNDFGNCYVRTLPPSYQLNYLEKKLGYPVKVRKAEQCTDFESYNKGYCPKEETVGYVIERR